MKVFKTALLGIILCCLAQTAWASEVLYRDTVSINGQVISIRSDVEIDSLLMKSGSWIDDLDVGILLRQGTNFKSSMSESTESYFKSSYIRFPELAMEINHPFFWSKSKQINYRAGVSVGASSRFRTDDLEGDIIGFYAEGNDVSQIILVSDPLQNESDTITFSKSLSPQVKISAGFEWHGVMRAARGWRLGIEVVFTPLRNQYVQYNKLLIDDPVLWESIDPSETFSIDETQFSRYHLKFFYTWSPWNSQFFFRNSWVWSPNNLQTAFTLGYHL